MIINEPFTSIGIVANEENNKIAALLFDKIIPLSKPETIPESLIEKITIDRKFNEQINDIRQIFQMEIFEESLIENAGENILKELSENRKLEFERYYRNEIVYELLLRTRKPNSIPVPKLDPIGFILKNSFSQNKTTSKQVEIELINAPLINVDGIEWEQIVEAKNDSDFKRKVRNFSLFINTDYTNKSIDYISDSLNKKVEEYKETLGKHGFNLANGTIREIINSKSIWGTTSLVLLSFLFATPAFAMTTGVVGAFLELGSLSMKISEKERLISEHEQNSEIALLIELEKLKTVTNNK